MIGGWKTCGGTRSPTFWGLLQARTGLFVVEATTLALHLAVRQFVVLYGRSITHFRTVSAPSERCGSFGHMLFSS